VAAINAPRPSDRSRPLAASGQYGVRAVKLTRDDWVEAAYQALLQGGPRAVAVAKLAEGLGVTRGSFYHYFDDREELLIAALERWEQEATETFIARASREPDPAARLRALFGQVFREPTALAAAERYLLADRANGGAAGQVVDRVIARRQAFLADCYRALGHNRTEAEDRAELAYMLFTGWLYLEQIADRQPPADIERIAALAREMLHRAD